MMVRKMSALVTMVTAACCVLSGCTSQTTSSQPSASTTQPAVLSVCTPVDANQWMGVPQNFNKQAVANRLQVPIEKVQSGTFGTATCENPIPLTAIENGTATVSVNKQGTRCAVVGIKQDPSTVTESKDVMAICAAD